MAPQARYWLLTIPFDKHPIQPSTKDDLVYIKGQQERGATGYHHWQLLAVFSKKLRTSAVKRYFCREAHCEPSRSEAANEYVWKEDTRVEGTQFEIGSLPLHRNNKNDWDKIYEDAKSGDIDNIPKDIVVRHYNSLKRIRVDNMQPCWRHDIKVTVYWGGTGIGKSRRAFHEAGDLGDVYIKDPNSKWWDGYRGQSSVIIDEFVGNIGISHLLRWFDRYPCNVETKGYSQPLLATTFYVTSNLSPRDWYPDAAMAHHDALSRRILEFHMMEPWVPLELDNILSPSNLTEDTEENVHTISDDDVDSLFSLLLT